MKVLSSNQFITNKNSSLIYTAVYNSERPYCPPQNFDPTLYKSRWFGEDTSWPVNFKQIDFNYHNEKSYLLLFATFVLENQPGLSVHGVRHRTRIRAKMNQQKWETSGRFYFKEKINRDMVRISLEIEISFFTHQALV